MKHSWPTIRGFLPCPRAGTGAEDHPGRLWQKDVSHTRNMTLFLWLETAAIAAKFSCESYPVAAKGVMCRYRVVGPWRIEKADDNEQAAQGLQYHILDVRICRKAFASLHLMGEHPRLRGLVSAVMQGRSQAPTDKRYLKRNQSQTSVKTGEVYSYLENLV